MKKLYTFLSIVLISAASQAQVVISQVYGGGGNASATYSNDFIELFNAGLTPQNLSGWSVQYASANGSSWAMTALPNFTLLPGQYFLIKEAAGATPVLDLPTPDLDGMSDATTGSNGLPLTTGLAMSGSNGKVILSNTVVAETTADPTGANIQDKVAYGTTSTSGFEGTGTTGTALTNSTSAQRNSEGCADSQNNAADFTAAAPTPRNSASALHVCGLGVNGSTIAGLKVYPNPVTNGKLFIETSANAEKSVVVYDVLGKVVVNTTTSNNEVNVSTLKGGVYIVKITEEGNSVTRKFVIK
ncbi:T9SS type A sorting domain-containing protein [Flavobacterium sp. 3HN19-14]|uniref:T9SS type A sorting domain-containing protein n=1 Tax=Flavobacterium sp. 3HN19-14 TaxID=3448133 RepID=UPI003EE2926F